MSGCRCATPLSLSPSFLYSYHLFLSYPCLSFFFLLLIFAYSSIQFHSLFTYPSIHFSSTFWHSPCLPIFLSSALPLFLSPSFRLSLSPCLSLCLSSSPSPSRPLFSFPLSIYLSFYILFYFSFSLSTLSFSHFFPDIVSSRTLSRLCHLRPDGIEPQLRWSVALSPPPLLRWR